MEGEEEFESVGMMSVLWAIELVKKSVSRTDGRCNGKLQTV